MHMASAVLFLTSAIGLVSLASSDCLFSSFWAGCILQSKDLGEPSSHSSQARECQHSYFTYQ